MAKPSNLHELRHFNSECHGADAAPRYNLLLSDSFPANFESEPARHVLLSNGPFGLHKSAARANHQNQRSPEQTKLQGHDFVTSQTSWAAVEILALILFRHLKRLTRHRTPTSNRSRGLGFIRHRNCANLIHRRLFCVHGLPPTTALFDAIHRPP